GHGEFHDGNPWGITRRSTVDQPAAGDGAGKRLRVDGAQTRTGVESLFGPVGVRSGITGGCDTDRRIHLVRVPAAVADLCQRKDTVAGTDPVIVKRITYFLSGGGYSSVSTGSQMSARNSPGDPERIGPGSNRHEEKTMTEILNAFIENFNVVLQTISTGSADLIDTVV
ncbi:hypothetical protein O4106_23410, partial [Rhodococcus pyridinivorans]|uniref:hypothetical protein n=1 Tax=Rhodococcus pyridinivorans TaxID=103816 RepID=UPI001E4B39F7